MEVKLLSDMFISIKSVEKLNQVLLQNLRDGKVGREKREGGREG